MKANTKKLVYRKLIELINKLGSWRNQENRKNLVMSILFLCMYDNIKHKQEDIQWL